MASDTLNNAKALKKLSASPHHSRNRIARPRRLETLVLNSGDAVA
jgi:hypothetical protein